MILVSCCPLHGLTTPPRACGSLQAVKGPNGGAPAPFPPPPPPRGFPEPLTEPFILLATSARRPFARPVCDKITQYQRRYCWSGMASPAKPFVREAMSLYSMYIVLLLCDGQRLGATPSRQVPPRTVRVDADLFCERRGCQNPHSSYRRSIHKAEASTSRAGAFGKSNFCFFFYPKMRRAGEAGWAFRAPPKPADDADPPSQALLDHSGDGIN